MSARKMLGARVDCLVLWALQLFAVGIGDAYDLVNIRIMREQAVYLCHVAPGHATAHHLTEGFRTLPLSVVGNTRPIERDVNRSLSKPRLMPHDLFGYIPQERDEFLGLVNRP